MTDLPRIELHTTITQDMVNEWVLRDVVPQFHKLADDFDVEFEEPSGQRLWAALANVYLAGIRAAIAESAAQEIAQGINATVDVHVTPLDAGEGDD